MQDRMINTGGPCPCCGQHEGATCTCHAMGKQLKEENSELQEYLDEACQLLTTDWIVHNGESGMPLPDMHTLIKARVEARKGNVQNIDEVIAEIGEVTTR